MGIPVSEEATEELMTFSETHLFSPALLLVLAVFVIVAYIIWKLMSPFAGHDHLDLTARAEEPGESPENRIERKEDL